MKELTVEPFRNLLLTKTATARQIKEINTLHSIKDEIISASLQSFPSLIMHDASGENAWICRMWIKRTIWCWSSFIPCLNATGLNATSCFWSRVLISPLLHVQRIFVLPAGLHRRLRVDAARRRSGLAQLLFASFWVRAASFRLPPLGPPVLKPNLQWHNQWLSDHVKT